MAAILKRLERTPIGRAKIAARPMRHQARTAGARLADLAALGKAIVLCPNAARKFRSSEFSRGYVPHPSHPTVQGTCDATGVMAPNLVLFIKELG